MKLEIFNRLTPAQAKEELFKCCGSTTWVNLMMQEFPFDSVLKVKETAEKAWLVCKENDFLEAFTHHPKIGEKPSANKTNHSDKWAAQEQSGVDKAQLSLLNELKELNQAYASKYGFIYIVCATGKSAGEMLHLLKERINNSIEKEIAIAAAEQNKITHLRIDKLFS